MENCFNFLISPAERKEFLNEQNVSLEIQERVKPSPLICSSNPFAQLSPFRWRGMDVVKFCKEFFKSSKVFEKYVVKNIV